MYVKKGQSYINFLKRNKTEKPVDDLQHFLDSNQGHRLVEVSSLELRLKHKHNGEQRD